MCLWHVILIKKMEINDFADLEIYKLAEEIAVFIYETTATYPEEEKYNLISQMRRAATSIGANIAESFGRYHYKEKIQFCRHARGSLEELKHFILFSKKIEYISDEIAGDFLKKHKKLQIKINKFIKSNNRKI